MMYSASDLDKDDLAMYTVTLEVATPAKTWSEVLQATSDRHLEAIRATARESAPVGSTQTIRVSRNW